MTESEILLAVVEKAERGGFKRVYACGAEGYDSDGECESSIIFDHDFLKAFFGEGERKLRFNYRNHCVNGVCPNCQKEVAMGHECSKVLGKAWQYHAQQLVLSEDRLEYLSQYL